MEARETGRGRLVCFDWGGVVLRICRSWEEGCERAGLVVHEDDSSPANRASRKLWAERYQLGLVSCETFREGIAAATKGRLTAEQVGRLHDAWLIQEYAGVADIVASLHRCEGVQTALLSNTNAGHWARHLPKEDGGEADFPTVRTLRYRFGSHLMRMAKPDSAIYEAVESSTGFRGSQIVFFDDLEENILAARAQGWRAFRIDHTGDTASQIADCLKREGISLS